MSLGKIEILTLIKDNSIKFLSSLIDLFPEEGDLIAGRILIEDGIPIEDFANKLTQNILPLEDVIVSRDERFFIEDNDVFVMANKDKVYKWKAIWQSDRLDEQDRKNIWKWVDLFLKLAKLYRNTM